MIVLDEIDNLYLGIRESYVCDLEYEYRQQLYEKLFSINSHDTSLIIPYLSNFYDSLSGLNYFDLSSKAQSTLLQVIPSDDLTSPDCKESHLLNPIQIRVYSHCQAFYASEKSYINIGFPSFLGSILLQWIKLPRYNKDFKGSLPEILKSVPDLSDRDIAYFKSFFTETAIKQTFYHELSHWISDTLHNNHILKGHSKAKSLKKTPSQHYKVPNMIFSPIELDAYMHGIQATKNLLGEEEWNRISLEDLFIAYPALYTIEKYEDKNYTHNFKKALVSRMNREGLLGNNMKSGT